MTIRIFLFILLLGLAPTGHAADEPKFVNQTFQEIQKRVVSRDPECGAILRVKAKDDAPPFASDLNFSFEEDAGDAVIVISRNLKAGEGVYEKYLLRMDDALRQELENQKRLKALAPGRETKALEEQKKKVAALSGGKLRYGMSLKEVTKVLGQPRKIEPWQAMGAFTAIYPKMSVDFWNEELSNIKSSSE